MYDRLADTVNGLTYQGQPILDAMKVNKLMKGLSKQWDNIKTSLQETQRIMSLLVNGLIGTLQSYELNNRIRRINPKVRSQLL